MGIAGEAHEAIAGASVFLPSENNRGEKRGGSAPQLQNVKISPSKGPQSLSEPQIAGRKQEIGNVIVSVAE
jgi:hypothetical protein